MLSFLVGPANRLRLALCAVGLLISCASALSFAAGLALDEAITTALQNNKDLQAARYVAGKARAQLLQAGALPNPRLNLSRSSDFLFRNEGQFSRGVGISQEFPIAGRIARQKDVAQVDVALADAEINRAERRLAGEVAAAFYRLLALDKQIQERDRLAGVDQKLLKATRNRFKAAEVSELDVTTAQLELERLKQERTLLQGQRATQLAQLNQSLGRPVAELLQLDDTVPTLDALPSLEALQKQALVSRPDLRTESLGADRAHAELALARAQRWEDWTVSVGIQQDRLAISGAPPQSSDFTLGATLSIPLPLLNRNQGRIAEAIAARDQAAARIEALTFNITNEVAAAYAETERLRQAVEGYRRDILLLSERNVSLAQRAYNQGLTPLFAVIQVQRQHSDASVAYLNILDQYLQALAKLRYGLVGGPAEDSAASTQSQRGAPSRRPTPASAPPADLVR